MNDFSLQLFWKEEKEGLCKYSKLNIAASAAK